jgi:broad specificity phosphatase PhoE
MAYQMTKFILIRHGEPRYDEVLARNYFGMGYDMGRLTDNGVLQAEKRAQDPDLLGADIIISSPYTRALQTAAIISRLTNTNLTVENDLHEWMPDTSFKFVLDASKAYDEYLTSKGIRNKDTIFLWESYDVLKNRVFNVIEKYKKYKKVIVVCHGIVMSTLTKFDDVIEHCGKREVML